MKIRGEFAKWLQEQNGGVLPKSVAHEHQNLRATWRVRKKEAHYLTHFDDRLHVVYLGVDHTTMGAAILRWHWLAFVQNALGIKTSRRLLALSQLAARYAMHTERTDLGIDLRLSPKVKPDTQGFVAHKGHVQARHIDITAPKNFLYMPPPKSVRHYLRIHRSLPVTVLQNGKLVHTALQEIADEKVQADRTVLAGDSLLYLHWFSDMDITKQYEIRDKGFPIP